ncbi:hypothetical protein QQ045_016393 [Rhodiola kirilowii]
MACVSSVKFSVLINGSLEGYFGSSRGLRQDDPISPYLFTLVMEVLSRLLGNMKRVGNFNYHPKCARTRLSHLMFADDVIIFSKANSSSLNLVRDVLRTFHEWSGLSVNVGKSAIYFGGCSEPNKNALASIVNFQKGQHPFTYLGVPICGRSLKVSDFSIIIHKMTSKIKSWAAKCLSYAGRLVLVKHVLSSIGSYWMRVLVFPSCVLKKILAICRNFLWSGSSSGKRNMVAWKKVCKPKEEGGLGLLNLCLFNKALLLWQIWDLVRKKDLLWIRWMNSYFLKDQTIWQCVVKSHHSWVRKKILSLREDAQKCIELLDNPVPTWRSSSNMFSTRGAYTYPTLKIWKSVRRPLDHPGPPRRTPRTIIYSRRPLTRTI